MNERIRELALQADKWAGTEFHRLFLNNVDASMKELFERKFAELIIQDCIDCVDGYTKPRTFDTHYDAVEQIKANFGVE
jgi:hypothetical protein